MPQRSAGNKAHILQQAVADFAQVMERQVAQAVQRGQAEAEKVGGLPRAGCFCSWARRFLIVVWRQHQLRETGGQSAHPAWQRDLRMAPGSMLLLLIVLPSETGLDCAPHIQANHACTT